MKRTAGFSRRWFVQYLSLLHADGEAEVHGCIKGAINDVLYGLLCVGEKGAVVSKQKLTDKFHNGFCVCEETPKVEQTAGLLTA